MVSDETLKGLRKNEIAYIVGAGPRLAVENALAHGSQLAARRRDQAQTMP